MSVYKYCESCGHPVDKRDFNEIKCKKCGSMNLYVDFDEWNQLNGRDFEPPKDEGDSDDGEI